MAQSATPAATRPLLSPREVAELAGVSRKTVYRQIDAGALMLDGKHVGAAVGNQLKKMREPSGAIVEAARRANVPADEIVEVSKFVPAELIGTPSS